MYSAGKNTKIAITLQIKVKSYNVQTLNKIYILKQITITHKNKTKYEWFSSEFHQKEEENKTQTQTTGKKLIAIQFFLIKLKLTFTTSKLIEYIILTSNTQPQVQIECILFYKIFKVTEHWVDAQTAQITRA